MLLDFLQDFLACSDVKLDKTFVSSLVSDIVKVSDALETQKWMYTSAEQPKKGFSNMRALLCVVDVKVFYINCYRNECDLKTTPVLCSHQVVLNDKTPSKWCLKLFQLDRNVVKKCFNLLLWIVLCVFSFIRVWHIFTARKSNFMVTSNPPIAW